jgi:hypothetical protein
LRGAKRCVPFSLRVENNINFIKNLLNDYPIERRSHCKIPEVTIKSKRMKNALTRINDEGKTEYLFSDKINIMSSPKLFMLREIERTHRELFNNFQKDLFNSFVIKNQIKLNESEINAKLEKTSLSRAEKHRQLTRIRGVINEYNRYLKHQKHLTSLIEDETKKVSLIFIYNFSFN